MRIRCFKLSPLVTLLVVAGCSDLTGPPSLLEQFNWEPVGDPSTVVEGIDVSTGLGDVFILGQLATPTRCFELEPNFSHDGQTLTLRVGTRETNTDTCAEGPGAFRYTAVIRNLDRGSYDIRVRHVVRGETKEYTETLET